MKRSRILPMDSAEHPRRPDRLHPIEPDPRFRAWAFRIAFAASLAFWLVLGFLAAAGRWPW
jgi:hypothetical protein